MKGKAFTNKHIPSKPLFTLEYKIAATDASATAEVLMHVVREIQVQDLLVVAMHAVIDNLHIQTFYVDIDRHTINKDVLECKYIYTK